MYLSYGIFCFTAVRYENTVIKNENKCISPYENGWHDKKKAIPFSVE